MIVTTDSAGSLYTTGSPIDNNDATILYTTTVTATDVKGITKTEECIVFVTHDISGKDVTTTKTITRNRCAQCTHFISSVVTRHDDGFIETKSCEVLITTDSQGHIYTTTIIKGSHKCEKCTQYRTTLTNTLENGQINVEQGEVVVTIDYKGNLWSTFVGQNEGSIVTYLVVNHYGWTETVKGVAKTFTKTDGSVVATTFPLLTTDGVYGTTNADAAETKTAGLGEVYVITLDDGTVETKTGPPDEFYVTTYADGSVETKVIDSSPTIAAATTKDRTTTLSTSYLDGKSTSSLIAVNSTLVKGMALSNVADLAFYLFFFISML